MPTTCVSREPGCCRSVRSFSGGSACADRASLVAASILDIIGAVGVTVAGNVPLNEKLDKVDLSKLSEAEADQIRNEYQGPGSPWMRFHTIRTLAATVATVLVFVACLSKNQ